VKTRVGLLVPLLEFNQLERDGITKTFDPRVKGKWSVYETEAMVIAVGDRVRLTESFKERGVAFKNNDITKVAAIDTNRITLDDGRSLRRHYLHLDQGVCITSHASECRTVRQMVAIAPLSSFSEMDVKSFYVLASRATHKAIFYTDCKDALREAVLRSSDRKSVWEYQKTANQDPAITPIVKKTQTLDLQEARTVFEPLHATSRTSVAMPFISGICTGGPENCS
jgi:hypothetical protein